MIGKILAYLAGLFTGLFVGTIFGTIIIEMIWTWLKAQGGLI